MGAPVCGNVVFWFNYFSPGVCYYVWFNHFIHQFLDNEFGEGAYRDLYPQALLMYHMTAASAGRADIVLCRPEYRLRLVEAQRTLLLHTLLCGRLALASDVCNMYFGFTLFEATPGQFELLAIKSPINSNWESLLKLTEDAMELKYSIPAQTRRGLSIMHSAVSSLFTTPEILSILEKIYPEIKHLPSSLKDHKPHNRFIGGLLSTSWTDAFLSRTLEDGTDRFTFVGDTQLLDEYVTPLIPDIRVILRKETGLHLHPCYKKHLFAEPVSKVPRLKSIYRPTGAFTFEEDHWPHTMRMPTSMRQRNEISEWVNSVLELAIDHVAEDPLLSQVKIGNYAPQLCMIEKLRYLKSRGLDAYDLAMIVINVSSQWKYDDSTLTTLSPWQMKALCKVYDEGDVRAIQKIIARRLKNPGIRLVWDPLDPDFLPFQFSFRSRLMENGQKKRKAEPDGGEREDSPSTVTTASSLSFDVNIVTSFHSSV